jgi:hypothetical protein
MKGKWHIETSQAMPYPLCGNGRGDWIRTSDLLNPIRKNGIFNNFPKCLI